MSAHRTSTSDPTSALLVIGFIEGRTLRRRRPARPRRARPASRSAMRSLARRAALPDRLRHVRPPADLPPHLRRARLHDPRRLRRLRSRLRSASRARSRSTRCRPCRATTTCSPATSSTTASKLWLIDYEYSGNNDPYFELGNCWTECGLDDDHLGRAGDRVRRPRVADTAGPRPAPRGDSRYGWSLWGFIQAATRDDDFDFYGWGQERFDKAVADFRSPEFETWLEVAAS